MSNIEKLIEELCPDGVEYVPLSTVAGYSTTRVDSKGLDNTTFVGVDNLVAEKKGRIDATYLPNTARLTAYEPNDILLGNIRPYLKKIWLATSEGGCSGDVLAVRIKPEHQRGLDPEFLYYLLSSDLFFSYDVRHAKGAKMPRGNKEAILAYRIPLPPLAVQQEIVRILDKFTALEAELEAELEARKKQYEHYRDLLLDFREAGGGTLIGDIAVVLRGASPRPIRSFITEDPEGIPWIKIGDVPPGDKYITGTAQRISHQGALKSRRVKPGDFVLSNSMSFGRPYISNIEGCVHDGWLVISGFEDVFISDYLYHLLRSDVVQSEFARRAGSGTVKNLNADIVKAVSVRIPTKERQAQVVALLDQFDALVNDLSVGLPAELAARRKQYEYYRDKLLTFKELGVAS